MSEERDFLSRWSRRKLEARTEEARRPEPEPIPAEPVADAPEEGLSEEEIAALPPVEELTAESDFGVFLRKGVPEAIKKAALRRMWLLDPAIRDYVGDARDYAYDWNVPGGVPGNGPLLPTDNVARMLKDIFRHDPESEPEPESEDETSVAAADAQIAPSAESPPEAQAVVAEGEPLPELVSVRLRDPSPRIETENVELSAAQPVLSPVRVPSRRHGGAKPA